MHPSRPKSCLDFHHVALLVNNLTKVEGFYSQVLGLEEEMRWYEADKSTLRSIWFRTGPASRLMLEKSKSTSPRADNSQQGWHLIALTIEPEQRPQWCDYLTLCGIPIVDSTPFSIYIDDPEGNRLALSHWPTPSSTHAIFPNTDNAKSEMSEN